MKSEIKSSEGLKREIEVEVPAETVDAAFAEIYHKFQKEAKIKGFRPGKIPMNVIKSKYGEAIREEILQDLIEKTYPQIIKEHNLKVASMPNITQFDIKEGSPLKYTAKLEVMPEIASINYGGLTLPDVKLDVNDNEIDTVVEYLRKKAATFRKVEREAQASDLLVMDLEKTDDPGKILSDSHFADTEIDLDNENTMPQFKEKLAGMKIGEEREVPVEYPADFANKMLAGNKITYKCKLKEVKERVLPEVNDAFSKTQTNGQCATLLEMRLKIRQDITQQKEHDKRQWQKRELMQQLIDKNQIEIPEAMVEKYLESVLEEARKENPDVDEKLISENYRPIATEAIRWNFLADHISESEKIEVLASDTENWIKSFAEGYKMELEKAKEVLNKSGRIKEIRNSLLEDKIFDFLLTKADIVPEKKEVEISGSKNPGGSSGEPDKKDE